MFRVRCEWKGKGCVDLYRGEAQGFLKALGHHVCVGGNKVRWCVEGCVVPYDGDEGGKMWFELDHEFLPQSLTLVEN